MYIYLHHILDDICQYTFIIPGEKNKEYRIKFSCPNYELVHLIILSIILDEDIYTIYCDSYNNYQLIEFLNQFRFIKINSLNGHDIKNIKDIENKIEEDDIIDIQINKNIKITG